MTKEFLIPTETTIAQVGNYRFTGKELGKGSFAVIKEAMHVKLKVHVSVKTIDLKKCNNYTLKNYQREGAILQQLEHPFIMRLFETMTYDNVYYMVTEIILGGDLCAYVQHKKGKVEENITRRFSRQISSALRYLHHKGIVHRDLKLENVMLDSAKRNIKLIDFGLTNNWSQNSPLKTLCGSPEYCAPELFVPGTVYGPEVDMWAFGVIMFALAAGRLPFPCLSGIMKVPEKKNQFLRTINDGLSETQTNLLKEYSPEFTQLVKGLMNPKWKERLTIEEVLQNKWITNRNHWVNVGHESLDAYDLEEIIQKLSHILRISPERLKMELKLRPYGEAGGYFKIMTYEAVSKKHNSMSDLKSKTFRNEMSNYSFSRESLSKQLPFKNLSQKPLKLSLSGNAVKVNEVTFTSSPARDNVSTPSDLTMINIGVKKDSPTKGQTKMLLQKMGCLKAKILSTPSSSPKTVQTRKEIKSEPSDTSRRKYTRTSGRKILPNKLKMTTTSKSLWEKEPHWLRKLV